MALDVKAVHPNDGGGALGQHDRRVQVAVGNARKIDESMTRNPSIPITHNPDQRRQGHHL